MNLKTIQLGSLVWLKAKEGDKEQIKEFMLVDPSEINPEQGRISVFFLLGHALLGKKEGDKLVVNISPYLRTYFEIKRVL